MTQQTHPRRPSRPGRATAALALLLAVVAGSAACGPTPPSPDAGAGRPTETAPSAPPAPSPAPAVVPDVPVRSAALADSAATEPAQPAAPVALAVPALDLTVPVDPVGVQDDGQMEIPPRAERAGWYRFGPAPGAAVGTAVIAAHVDSVASAGLGPFARLTDATAGDAVEVTLADGTTHRYVVTDVRRTPKTDVTWPDVFVRDGPPRLVLVTCGGVFQRDAGRYTDNVIVTAEPVGGS